MLRKLTFGSLTLIAALIVLFVSIYRAALVRYDFPGPNNSAAGLVFSTNVEYSLPYPGVMPDHPLWFLKATRDKTLLFFTTDPLKRAKMTLLLADARLVMAQSLQDKGKNESAVSTAIKAEGYLKEALVWGKDAGVYGYDVTGFYETILKSSLVHREILEKIMLAAPEEARPILNKEVTKSEKVYQEVIILLRERGKDL